MQREYFNFMQQVKHTVFYLDLYADRAKQIDTYVKLIIAFASSASITTWALWKKYPFLWSFIIAFSQVLTVINKYLPYKTMIQSIASFQIDLKLLYIDLESDWFNVSSGAMTEKKINKLLQRFKKQYAQIEGNIYKDQPVRINKKLQQKAEDQKASYFMNFFADDASQINYHDEWR